MAEVMAGFVCGYALALIVTPLAAIALVRARVGSPTLAQVVPQGTSLIAVSIILHVLAMLTLTAVGILLGLLLAGLEERSPDGGLGSPNQVFTIFILAATAIAVGPFALLFSRLRLLLLATGLLLVGLFGWFMPYLSLWGPE
jgi:hypothetical protein